MASRQNYRFAEVKCCGTCNHAYANSLAGGWCCTQGGPGEHQVTQPLMLCDQYVTKPKPGGPDAL